jgi:hydroxyethylthiazole kinase-like uncharacterized protein yjeF
MIDLTPSVLKAMPLPLPDGDAGKEDHGRLLIVAGSAEVPGAALLCAVAALRTGAGKLRVAVPESLKTGLGIAVPEMAVLGLPQSSNGNIDRSAATLLAEEVQQSDAVLIGPGMMDEARCGDIVAALLENPAARFVLDAGALPHLPHAAGLVRKLETPAILTPHAGEMAQLLSRAKEAITADPVKAACDAAQAFHAVVVLKGATTYITAPDGALYRNEHGAVGLGTGGSGDVLAGLIAALLGRGCTPVQAANWGVFVHAQAGERLSEKIGSLGFLAREIPAQIPAILDRLQS